MAANGGGPLMPSVVAVLNWSREDPRASIVLVLCAGVVAAGNIVLALAIAEAMEALTSTATIGQATWPIALLIGAGAVRGLVGLVRGRMLRRIRFRVISSQDDRMVSRLLLGHGSDAGEPDPGAVARALAAGDRAGELLFGDLTSALAEMALAPVVVAILWHFHPAMAAIGILVTLLNVILVRRFVMIDGQLARTRSFAQQRLAGILEEDLRSIEAIRMSRAEPAVAQRWRALLVAETDILRQAAVTGEAVAACQTALAMLISGVALGVGGALVLYSSDFGFEAFIASQTLLFALSDPVRRLLATHAESQRTTADLLMRQTLAEAMATSFVESPRDNPEASPTLTIRGNEPGGAKTVAPGEVAVAKSTGRVSRFDVIGIVRSVSAPAAMIPGTLAQNLTLFDEGIAEADLKRVLDLAQLPDLIALDPDGFERRIDAGVAVFSRGQLYRISVARALLDRPDFVVLSDGLGSLDPECQTRMIRALAGSGIGVLAVGASAAIENAADVVLADAVNP